MSFACKIFMYKKKNWSTTQCILLSEQNMGCKKVLRGSEQWRLPSFSAEFGVCPFFYNDLCGGEGNYPAAVAALVPALRGGRSWCRLCAGSVMSIGFRQSVPADAGFMHDLPGWMQLPHQRCQLRLESRGARSPALPGMLRASLSPLLAQKREGKASRILVCSKLVFSFCVLLCFLFFACFVFPLSFSV